MSLKTQFFIEAMRSINTTNTLPLTLGKVVDVKSEGYFVDVELSYKITNMQKFQSVPVLRNKYLNYPILKDDIVILVPFSHLIQNYLEKGEYANEDMVWTQCYFALPMCFEETYKHKNELSFRTPDEKFIISINDEKLTLQTSDGLKVEMDLKNLAIELQDFTLTAKGKIEMSAQQNLKISSQTPIEIGTSTATLGGILNDICTALNLAGAPVTTGSATTTPNPALAGQVSSIQTKIGGSFKQ